MVILGQHLDPADNTSLMSARAYGTGFNNYSGFGTVDPLASFPISGSRDVTLPVEYPRSGTIVIRFRIDQLGHGSEAALSAAALGRLW